MGSKNLIYYLFSVVRVLLYPIALLYGAIVWLRNRMYDGGFFSSISFSPPVIAVGNLSTGGTGKTPHVEYLVRLLQYQFRTATMSRGYKRHTQGFILADATTNALRIGDEPMQYHLKFPDLVVSVAEERMTGIPALLQRRPDVETIILDDAYQHRSVKAGMNILITDYTHPFYNDHILPFGSLRESRSAYKRANIIIVSKCPLQLNERQAADITKKINPLPHQQVYFSGIDYGQAYDFITGNSVALEHTNCVLVCGIARPEPLVTYLKQQAADVHTLPYKDHHYFVSADLEEIKAAHDNWDKPNKIIVTTEKDAARLHLHYHKLADWGIQIVVIPIEIRILLDAGAAFDQTITQFVERGVAENRIIFGFDEPNPEY